MEHDVRVPSVDKKSSPPPPRKKQARRATGDIRPIAVGNFLRRLAREDCESSSDRRDRHQSPRLLPVCIAVKPRSLYAVMSVFCFRACVWSSIGRSDVAAPLLSDHTWVDSGHNVAAQCPTPQLGSAPWWRPPREAQWTTQWGIWIWWWNGGVSGAGVEPQEVWGVCV